MAVYLIRAGRSSHYKIGYTDVSPEDRCRALQTGNPLRLHVVGAWEGSSEDGSALQAVFADHRLEGEWFDLSPDLVVDLLTRMSQVECRPIPCCDENARDFARPPQTPAPSPVEISVSNMGADAVGQLGRRIRDSRRRQGLTQQDFADLANVGVRFLSELERGKETAEIGLVLRTLEMSGYDLRLTPRDGGKEDEEG